MINFITLRIRVNNNDNEYFKVLLQGLIYLFVWFKLLRFSLHDNVLELINHL